jgi:hypothetical protein
MTGGLLLLPGVGSWLIGVGVICWAHSRSLPESHSDVDVQPDLGAVALVFGLAASLATLRRSSCSRSC